MLFTALAACGDPAPTTITVIDGHVALAFEIRSNTVRLERSFTKGSPMSFDLDVVGNGDAFPGPDQIPLGGDLFVTVENPSSLGDGALSGELPDHQRYQLSNQFLPATVSYAWYDPATPCQPGCTRHSMMPMTLADSLLGGVAPSTATVQLAFTATLTGWVVTVDSPQTPSPSISLDVR